jgi:hypothetical protein
VVGACLDPEGDGVINPIFLPGDWYSFHSGFVT